MATETMQETEVKRLLDFHWSYSEEPHRTRRQAIMKAHPEVGALCGPEPLTKWLVFLVVSLQTTAAILLRDSPVFSWKFMATAYLLGGTCNQNIFLAIHEISHNLAFKSMMANRYFAIFANLPIGLPYSAAFRPYHLEHHKHLGVDGIDTDLPTRFEALFLQNVLGKAFFATFQIFFYALRPMMVKAMPFTPLHFANIFTQLSFDYILISLFGWKPVLYLLFSSFFAGSLHPCAGHFIAEHYVFEKSLAEETGAPAETYSYYGNLNVLTYNVGYHNEHHDFPFIPWTRLPKLRAIASEFYKDLPQHESWSYVIFQFITDPKVGMFSRVKRTRPNKEKA
jgi:sphingolipid delta-4 desaturase